MRVHFGAKMFEHRQNGGGHDLAKAANGGQTHGLAKLGKERVVRAVLRFGNTGLSPAHQQIDHFLGAHAAGNAFAAGLVPVKTHRVEGHVQHAGGVVANDDGAGAKHGAGFRENFEIQANIDHGGGQIAGGRAGWSEGLELAAARNTAGIFVYDIAHGNAHGNLVDTGFVYVPADAHELQSVGAAAPLGKKPFDAFVENLRDVGEGFDVVEGGGLLPHPGHAGERGFIAGFRAVPFDGFDQRAFLATDVSAGTDKQFEIEIERTSQDSFAKNAGAV